MNPIFATARSCSADDSSAPTPAKHRGLLFQAAMVLAQLDGRKTQTRRIMNPQPSEDWQPHSYGEVHCIVDGEPDPEDAKAEGCAPAFSHRVYPSKHAAKVKLYREGYRLLWNSISLKPKPVYDTIDGQRKIVRYASFPWSLEDFYAAYPDQREAIEDRAMFTWRGNPLTVTPNPFVWVLTFQRLLP